MKRDPITTRASIAFLLLLVAGQRSARTQEAVPPDRVFSAGIGVEVVSIDVVVRGEGGEPVTGLERDDFELEIDGEPVEITNFYAVDPRAPESADATEAVADPAVLPEIQEPPQGGTTTSRAVLFFDDFYLAPGGRRRLFEALPGFVDRLVAQGTEVMLVAHDRKTRILASFTRDPEALSTALAVARDLPASGYVQGVQRISTLSSISGLFETCRNPCVECWPAMVSYASGYRSGIENDRRGTMDALGALVDALNLHEGRKVLYYFSDGFQQQAGADMFQYLAEVCPANARAKEVVEAQLRLDGLDDFHRLTAAANASQVTIDSIEAAGLQTPTSGSVEINRNPSPVNDSIRIGNLQGTLSFLAHETGGRAVLNANSFAPDLEALAQESESYYSLGFAPTHAGEDRIHRVEVRVRGQGRQRVAYRRSYLHKGAERLLAEKTLGAFFLGEISNPLGVEAGIEPFERRDAGTRSGATASIRLRIPWERLLLLENGPAVRGRLLLLVAAPTGRGGKRSLRKIEIPVDRPSAAPRTGYFETGVRVALPEGRQDLWVAVRDEIADRTSYLRLEVDGGAEPSGTSGAKHERR